MVALDVASIQHPEIRYPDETWVLTFFASLIVALFARLSGFEAFKASDVPGTLGVDDEMVTFTSSYGAGWIPLSEIEEVQVATPGYLGLRRENGDILHIAAAKLAKVIAAIDAGGPRRALRLKLGETVFASWIGGLAGLPAAFGAASLMTVLMRRAAPDLPSALLHFAAFFGCWLAAYRASQWYLGAATLIIGSDGVTIDAVFSKRFVAFPAIASVETRASSVLFRLKNGATIVANARHMSAEHRAFISERIVVRVGAPARLASGVELSVLDRKDRPITAWRSALAGLTESAKAYRVAPISAEQLLDVLINPDVGPERHLAAAMALSGSEGPGRARVLIASYASASEPMREALKTISEGRFEDATIGRALRATDGVASREPPMPSRSPKGETRQ